MNRSDRPVSGEVPRVIRENLLYAMSQHRCGDPGIVNLNSLDSMLNDQSSPLGVNERSVVQDRQKRFEVGQPPISVFDRQPNAVLVCRPCANVPELSEILRKHIDRFVGQQPTFNRVDRIFLPRLSLI